MKYKNTVTGEVIEVDASISDSFWEEVDEIVVEPGDDEKPKSKTTRKGRNKRA